MHRSLVVALCASAALACGQSDARTLAGDTAAIPDRATAPSTAGAVIPAASPSPAPPVALAPNELGRVPILEYHLIGDKEAKWEVEREHFRRNLELLYERGYRPVSVSQLVDRKFDLPAGRSPVVFTFDDASPSQFRYIERNGTLEIDPSSAVGIWLDFRKTHPDWGNNAVFCLLSGAEAGRSLFGNKGIEGQKDAWRFQKVRFLHEQGFELCNHTLWHAQLNKYPDGVVQEQIARGVMAIDSAVPGYKVRTFALPLGLWPKNRALARRGAWTDPKTKRVVRYDFDAILEVAGGPNASPHDAKFDALSLDRSIVYGNELEKLLDHLDRTETRYVSDGDPRTVARPVMAPLAVATPAHKTPAASPKRRSMASTRVAGADVEAR